MVPRRFLKLPNVVIVITVLGIIFYSGYLTGHINKLNPYQYSKPGDSKPASPEQPSKVILLESGGSHEEVTTAFLSSLVDSEAEYQAVVYPFFKQVRFKMANLMKAVIGDNRNVAKHISSNNLTDYNTLVGRPDVVVSVTCEHDSQENSEVFGEWLDNGVSLVCIVHHADRWIAESEYGHYKRLIPWIEKKQVTFITLSEHVNDYLRHEAASTWESKHQQALDARVFVPVFKAPLRPQKTPMKELGLNLQGDFDSKRRDYQSLFGDLEKIVKSMAQVKLYIVGHGIAPEVPATIKEKVQFVYDLPFTEFYAHMSEGLAILPAFASGDYYTVKASSSVPAAVIAGVPVVGNQKMLDTYTYLDEEDIWVAEDGETDIQAIYRLVSQINDPTSLEKQLRFRQRRVLNKRDKLIDVNRKIMKSLLKFSSQDDHLDHASNWEWSW